MKVNPEPSSWQEMGYVIESTMDGSPTLKDLQHLEPMHHSGGALEETELIYGRPIADTLSKLKTENNVIEFCVVGLGLGYIEMTIVREALKADIPIQRLKILSFESDANLSFCFKNWILGLNLAEGISRDYDFILRLIGGEIAGKIKESLKAMSITDQFEILGGLNSESFKGKKADCILYDAFSAKTTPEIWSEDFLYEFLKEVAKPFCCFSTYASRSALKRALVKVDFEFATLEGFKSKRNSTKAFKYPHR